MTAARSCADVYGRTYPARVTMLPRLPDMRAWPQPRGRRPPLIQKRSVGFFQPGGPPRTSRTQGSYPGRHPFPQGMISARIKSTNLRCSGVRAAQAATPITFFISSVWAWRRRASASALMGGSGATNHSSGGSMSSMSGPDAGMAHAVGACMARSPFSGRGRRCRQGLRRCWLISHSCVLELPSVRIPPGTRNRPLGGRR